MAPALSRNAGAEEAEPVGSGMGGEGKGGGGGGGGGAEAGLCGDRGASEPVWSPQPEGCPGPPYLHYATLPQMVAILAHEGEGPGQDDLCELLISCHQGFGVSAEQLLRALIAHFCDRGEQIGVLTVLLRWIENGTNVRADLVENETTSSLLRSFVVGQVSSPVVGVRTLAVGIAARMEEVAQWSTDLVERRWTAATTRAQKHTPRMLSLRRGRPKRESTGAVVGFDVLLSPDTAATLDEPSAELRVGALVPVVELLPSELLRKTDQFRGTYGRSVPRVCFAKLTKKKLVAVDSWFAEYAPDTIAAQLTLVDAADLCAIDPAVLVCKGADKDAAVVQMVMRFNACVEWVGTELTYLESPVLGEVVTVATLMNKFRCFIAIGDALRLRGNFHGLFKIASGLYQFAQRLTKLCDGLEPREQRTFALLLEIVDPAANFRAYRAMLEEAEADTEAGLPLPALCIVLKDLAMLHEPPSRSRVHNEAVNVDKFRHILAVAQLVTKAQNASTRGSTDATCQAVLSVAISLHQSTTVVLQRTRQLLDHWSNSFQAGLADSGFFDDEDW